jgi:RNA polymerase sigma factor for flagellar operon FliA
MSGNNDAEKLTAEEKAEMLKKYKETGDKALRNNVVMAYMNVVRYAAVSTRNMYEKYADSEDIINEATIALMGAIESFDPDKNVKFETYASIKVRGAVIDYIRRQDIVPRNVRRFAREYDKAFAELFTRLDREPTDGEMAEFMKLPRNKYENFVAKSAAAQTLSFEDLVINNNFDIPDEASEDGLWSAEASLYREEKMKYLAEAIASLRDKERLVITLYYYEKLKFTDIGEVLEVSESRVCQIHAQAVAKMKKYMANYISQM